MAGHGTGGSQAILHLPSSEVGIIRSLFYSSDLVATSLQPRFTVSLFLFQCELKTLRAGFVMRQVPSCTLMRFECR